MPSGHAHIVLHAPGRHMASNALAAAAVAHAAHLPVTAIVRGLEAFRPVRGRLVTVTTSADVTVIDDSYNANPDSVRAAVDVLAARPRPRWLVLGDMGEVGEAGAAFHAEIGTYARESGVERMLAVGVLSRDAVHAFGAGAEHFESVDTLAQRVAGDARAGVTVLVKGSRFMRMERVVAALTGQDRGGAH
jgi:UDP-N-acetylmuramoyl-tripeptide--D-alanyl-D-alanine ligase